MPERPSPVPPRTPTAAQPPSTYRLVAPVRFLAGGCATQRATAASPATSNHTRHEARPNLSRGILHEDNSQTACRGISK